MHDEPGDPAASIRDDEERVRREYARRAGDPRMRRYVTRIEPALSRAQVERRGLLLAELARLGERSRLRLLDVGCGPGHDLAFLAGVGFAESNLAGVDVVAERVTEARARVPGADVRLVNAATLPFLDETFDAVLQAVALSSVVDPVVRRQIAAEMLRVTRRGGRVISYDMAVVLGRNPHLVAISRGELRRLFGSTAATVTRLTLMLPIASRAPRWLRRAADRVPQLHSHLQAVVIRDDD